ncbi:hypothetical protein [Aestuariivirga litoralis]|uniref:hypothetical protein n=1 Tax=Aestuariivirga litoralis TaxID=2650924 RepID=UPI0018C4C575|nr:hypothetical protein [Aestuariivirga litoralis]MBG1231742.1 hypothetical protein [Aestuariivirga litoralis]
MALETVHGILRGIFLVPRLGIEMSNRIGWPIAAALVFGITLLTSRWMGLSGTRALLQLGALWVVLTFAFEIAIGLMQGLNATQLIHEINPFSGGMLMWSLVVAFLSPFAAARLRQ